MNVFILFCVDGVYPFTGDDTRHEFSFVSSSFYNCLDHITKENLEKHHEKFIINEYDVDRWLPVSGWHYFKDDGGIEKFENWIKVK